MSINDIKMNSAYKIFYQFQNQKNTLKPKNYNC